MTIMLYYYMTVLLYYYITLQLQLTIIGMLLPFSRCVSEELNGADETIPEGWIHLHAAGNSSACRCSAMCVCEQLAVSK